MHNIWMLAKANLRKSKSQTFTMFLLITITAMLMNIGFVLFFSVGNFFDKRAEELYAPHFVVVQTGDNDSDIRLNYIRKFPGVLDIESQSVLKGSGTIHTNDAPIEGHILIAVETTEQRMNPPSLIGDSISLTDNTVYIPHFLFLSGGYTVGDDFIFDFMGSEHIFTVAGSTEEIMFGSSASNIWRIYVSDSKYKELQAEFSDSRHTLISARMKDGGEVLTTAYTSEFSEFGDIALSYGNIRNLRTMIPIIAAMVIVVFAAILLMVGVIVVRFRISNDIEEGMKNIGVLKAIGYCSRQIISSIVLQFAIIAFVSGFVGVALSQIALPMIAGIFEPMLGLLWNPAFNFIMIFVSIIIVLSILLLFSYVSSRRIAKLHPLNALRSGIFTHNFTKNYLPLDEARGFLSILLACKQILGNKKQAIMVCLIISIVTFASVGGFAIHYNINENPSAFQSLFGEIPDFSAMLNKSEDGVDFQERMERNPEVELVLGYEDKILSIDETAVTVTIVEDFTSLAGNELIEGRFPILYNEIVLDHIALSVLDKNVGDWVTLKSGSIESEYIITGMTQRMGGLRGMINLDGKKQLQPDFEFSGFYVYLTEGADTDTMVEAVKQTDGDILFYISSAQAQYDTQMDAMSNIFSLVNIAINLVVVIVVTLVLYLIIKTIIIRRKQELGIQKALGFTTLQLMNQIALSLSPAIIIGIALGAVACYFGFNPLFVATIRGMGIAQANLISPINWTIIVSVCLILLTYSVSMLVAWRIRKISVYSLISE